MTSGVREKQLLRELEALEFQVDRLRASESELKRSVVALAEIREDMRNLLDSASGFAIYQLAFDEQLPLKTRIARVSPSIKDVLGLNDPMKLENWLEHVHPDDAERVVAANLRAWLVGGTLNEIGRFFHPGKKEWRWLQVIANGVIDPEGKNSRCTGIIVDVTEQKLAEHAAEKAKDDLERRVEERTAELATANMRLSREVIEKKQAEEALNRTRHFFQSIIEKTSDGTTVLDEVGRTVYQSPSIKGILGYEPEEMTGLYLLEFIHPDDRDKLLTIFHEGKKLFGGEQAVQCRVRHKDGSWRITEAVATNLLHDELIRGIVINYRDVTERKRAEERIRATNEKFEKIFYSQREAILILDAKVPPVILDCNPAAVDIFGYQQEELTGRTTGFLHVSEAKLAEFQNILYPMVEKQGYFSILDFPMKRKSGEIFPTDLNVLPLLGQSSERIGWVSVVRDITERKRSAEERDRLFNLSIDMLCVAGFDGFFKQLNPAWTKCLGWSPEELKSKPWLDFVHPEDRRATIEAGARLGANREVLSFENRYLCKDGSYRWISWNSFPLMAQSLIFAVARDITDHKQHEQDREKLIFELQTALAEVKTLSGLLPICSKCKKIRDDQGYWQQVEQYIGHHSRASFTHSICPDCIKELYPEMASRILKKLDTDNPDQ